MLRGVRSFCFLLTCLLWLPGVHAARSFEDSMAQRTLACTGCHGEQGRAGPDGYYPRLAGKPAGYLYNQLVHIREGRRHYPLMAGLLVTLDDAYLREIANYFAGLSVPYPAPSPSKATPADLARGRTLVQDGDRARGIPACSQCHGRALTGVMPNTPSLLGLPADYLNAQLGGWQTGQRRAAAPDCMARIARQLSAADISAMASWLATQPVPGDGHAAQRRPASSAAALALPCGSLPETVPASDAKPAPASLDRIHAVPAGNAQLARGSYLARIGNCALCHTTPGGAPYAGGRAIDTPFGAVRASNLTADPVHGLGAWSADDFWRALNQGLSKDGRALYPAFPYTSYTRLRREDSDALFAFLKTVPAVAQPNQAHQLRWPFSTQMALRAWRALYFKPMDQHAPASEDALARGAYLVQGLGHCMECHGTRNRLGALTDAAAGSVLPGSPWFAPSLQDPQQAGVGDWSEADIVQFLQQGRSARGQASGPMAEVVLHSTQYLSTPDARAMARYLQALPRVALPGTAQSAAPASNAAGAKLYETHCADCHGLQGQGRAPAYPALAGSRMVRMDASHNLIQMTLGGGYGPATAGHPRPFGMPPFTLQLSDTQLSQVLSYVRHAWGNQAGVVSEFDINKFRRTQAP